MKEQTNKSMEPNSQKDTHTNLVSWSLTKAKRQLNGERYSPQQIAETIDIHMRKHESKQRLLWTELFPSQIHMLKL